MKIIKNENSLTEYFSKVDLGEIIEYENDIYLTINTISNFNAVNIKNGHLHVFENFDLVIHHGNAKLIINN